MSILGDLKSYWTSNATLTAALPATSVFVDYVPPSVSLPYARITEIGETTDYVTTGGIRDYHFQISIFDTDLDALTSTADTIQNQLETVKLATNSMHIFKENRITTGEVINGIYTYHIMLQFEVRYNTLS